MGLSRQPTADKIRKPQIADNSTTDGFEPQQTAVDRHLENNETDRPFTEEELTLALTKTTIEA